MKIKTVIAVFLPVLLLGACANQSGVNNAVATSNVAVAKPTVDRVAEEKALRETDMAWSAVAGKLDVDGTVAFMMADGVTMSSNVPAAKGREAIRKEWQGLLGLKDVTISWEPASVQVADSGELGYTTVTWKMSWTDPKGKLEDHGKYLEVWKKHEGKWLCSYDMYSSDQPAPTVALAK